MLASIGLAEDFFIGKQLSFPPRMSEPEIGLDDLLREVATGNRHAFERVYDVLSPTLYALALRMLARVEDAEDLVQEVFVKIWSDASAYDPSRGTGYAWASTILRHRAIDRIRSRGRRERLHDEAGKEPTTAKSNPQSPATAAASSESAAILREKLETLAPEVRATLELAYYSGLSQTEIAEELKIPITTVKSHARRAMLVLRQNLLSFQ